MLLSVGVNCCLVTYLVVFCSVLGKKLFTCYSHNPCETLLAILKRWDWFTWNLVGFFFVICKTLSR